MQVMEPLIVVPILPDRDLATNSRDGKLHWGTRRRWVAKAREDFGRLLRQEDIEALRRRMPLEPLALRWVLVVPAWRGDVDGWAAAIKPWQDSLVDVGLIPNDGPWILREVTYRVERDPHRAPMTMLYIEHLGAVMI